jgi:hypothetical protein
MTSIVLHFGQLYTFAVVAAAAAMADCPYCSVVAAAGAMAAVAAAPLLPSCTLSHDYVRLAKIVTSQNHIFVLSVWGRRCYTCVWLLTPLSPRLHSWKRERLCCRLKIHAACVSLCKAQIITLHFARHSISTANRPTAALEMGPCVRRQNVQRNTRQVKAYAYKRRCAAL